MTISEIVSLVASILVFVSYLFKDQRKLRKVNLVASIVFIVYGLLLLIETQWRSGYSILVLNTGTALMHLFYLTSNGKDKKASDSTKEDDNA